MEIAMLLVFGAILLFAVVLRLTPHWLAPHGLGVDHWFWKVYIEKYRSDRCFPPVLKQFLLDDKQWYPPLLPLFISLFPDRFFDRYNHLIAIIIDLLRLCLLLGVIYLITGRMNSVLLGGVVYSLTPILITYNIQLNPRGFGALFLDVVVLAMLWMLFYGGGLWLLAVVFLFSGLILLTHKMTTQLFWFLSLTGAAIFENWWVLGLIPFSIVSALLLSKGFYWKVLKAHWDIVTFWHRNWHWLSAHPIHSSPLYGDGKHEANAGFFQVGLFGLFRRVWFVVGFNPWMYAAFALAVFATLSDIMLFNELGYVLVWSALIFTFILITTFIPYFRSLGLGYLYLYNSAFPVALFISLLWGGKTHGWLANLTIVGALMACVTGIGFYYYTLTQSKTLRVDADMDKALDFLNEQPDGVVLCLPLHWSDLAAYKTGKDVLWGAHGYGFRKIEFLWPIWRRPVNEVVSQYHVRYLLTYDSYLPKHFLDEFDVEDTYSFGDYRLHVVNESVLFPTKE